MGKGFQLQYKQTHDLNHTHSLTSMQYSRHSTYKMRVAFSKVVHAARVRVSLPGANHGPLPGKPSICPPTFMYCYCECKPKNEMQGKALETKLLLCPL